MSIRTIAVLREAELKDGQMFFIVVLVVRHTHGFHPGKKSLSRAKAKSCSLALEIKYMPLVPFVPIMAHLLPMEY
jgi:hypothetical protein